VDKDGFTEYLKERNQSEEQIAEAISLAEGFEIFAADEGLSIASDPSATEAVHRYSARMIDAGSNIWDNYVTLVRFGRFIGNDAVYIAALELIDGAEALGNLYDRLGETVGESVRDRVFEGVEIPPLGMPNVQKPPLTATVMHRLEEAVDRETCVGLLKDSLRNLESDRYLDAKRKYEEAESVDAYLERKRADFIAELEKHRDEGTLFFSQPINGDVISYVKAHPEIEGGVHEGDVIIEAKIPHQAVKFLVATDPAEKAYHYCHCPWAKESLKDGPSKVSPTFCNCSAGFHKKPYEVIFGQKLEAEVLETVLAGDPWCKFAIHLPDRAV
jgi:hypothetical protein